MEIQLKGTIGFQITLAEIIGHLKANEGQEVTFIVETLGGFVDEAERIYNYLKTVSNVNIIFENICASAGTFAFLSISKEKRKAYADTDFAIHLPYNDYFLESMNVNDLEQDKTRLDAITEKIKNIYEAELNMTREEIDLLMAPESFFSEKAAIGYHYITEVIEKKKDTIFDKIEAQNKICAFLNKNQKQENNMEKQELEKMKKDINDSKTFMQKMAEKLGFSKTLNLLISSEEGADIDFADDDIKVGTSTTGVEDGTYTIMYKEKKWSVKIESNKVTELTEIVEENEEVENLKKENEELKNKISELEKNQSAQNEMKKDFETLKSKISELEKLEVKAQNFIKGKENINNTESDYLKRKQQRINNKK